MKKYISGNIRRIIYESNNSPYKVGIFRVKESNCEEFEDYIDKTIGFTGNFNDINYDIDYLFYGKMINHPKYGIQFSVESYEIKKPSDKESLIVYLSSGMFPGIGEKTAKKIVDRFDKDTIDIIKNDYEKLSLISGMTLNKAKIMHDKIVSSDMNQELILKLNSYGFTVKEAIDLINIYKSELLNIINDNIYQLIEYVQFDKLDTIFLSSHEEMHPYRIEALIKNNIYNMCFESGNTLVQKDELFIKMKRCFNSDFNSEMFLVYLNNLINNNEIVLIESYVTLYEFYDAEKYIITNIRRISNIKDSFNKEKFDDLLKQFEDSNNIKFDDEQRKAIMGAIKNNFFIITGGPGTGKTTIIKAIVQILEDLNKIKKEDLCLLAPTGRSAKRICESVGVNAYTIHKFLKWNKETKTFNVDENCKASEKVIIVDEASMVDVFLFSSLLKGLRMNIKLILIGDANQLPSIAPGDVLHDLINLNEVNSICLNTIYRVKKGSYITYLSQDIRNKKEFNYIENYNDFKFYESNDEDIKNYLKEICLKIKEKNISIDNFQVLAPMYKGLNGIDNLNSIMSTIFNPDNNSYQIGDKYYKINDKVIQLVNDVENNVFNGDIGYISDIYYVDKKMCVEIDFQGNKVVYTNGEFDRFNLAYAISIHKSQGSEYDNVVIILAKSFNRMFYNKLIYTGVTRAKHSLIIIGSLDSFNKTIQTSYSESRNTYLKHV